MSQVQTAPYTCDSCRQPIPVCGGVSYGSLESGYRQLCNRCFNEEIARSDGIDFQHIEFQPLEMLDVAGERHEFHFRLRLLGDLRAAVGSLLESLGVSGETVAGEIAAMEPVAFGRATNRHVLGSMNEFAFQASVHLARGDDLLTISRRLADTPMSAIGAKRWDYGYPREVGRELLTMCVD